MVNQPTIDIIIPNFNKAKYLDECLNSIINQTYKKWKIYLIDDNSNDNSSQILKKYEKFDNIKIFNLKENKGPSVGPTGRSVTKCGDTSGLWGICNPQSRIPISNG